MDVAGIAAVLEATTGWTMPSPLKKSTKPSPHGVDMKRSTNTFSAITGDILWISILPNSSGTNYNTWLHSPFETSVGKTPSA